MPLYARRHCILLGILVLFTALIYIIEHNFNFARLFFDFFQEGKFAIQPAATGRTTLKGVNHEIKQIPKQNQGVTLPVLSIFIGPPTKCYPVFCMFSAHPHF